MADARAAEEQAAEGGDLSPFLGVPIPVKELTTAAGPSATAGPRPATDPFGLCTQWLEERVQTRGLDAEQVAVAHHVSVRHVRAVFAGNGSTVSSFVRARRLEHLRHDLLDPSLATCTVAGWPGAGVWTTPRRPAACSAPGTACRRRPTVRRTRGSDPPTG